MFSGRGATRVGNSLRFYRRKAYNPSMARGWESKSIEAQIEESGPEKFPSAAQNLTAEERQAALKKNNLMLSRKRILQQLEQTPNERYSELLRRTLASLDAEISALS